jgi:hypothetical protein
MRSYTFACLGLITLVAAGCSSERANSEPPSYQEIKEDELDSERQEFINETQQRLGEVEREREHLAVKLKHEAKFVDAEERAVWSQELFDLGQERERLHGELERAQTTNNEEWKQMRGDIGVATDSLQAAMSKLSAEVSSGMSSNAEAEQEEAQAGLCTIDVDGTNAEVNQTGNAVVVVVTTDDKSSVPQLQERAKAIAEADTYPQQSTKEIANRGNTSEASAAEADAEPIAVAVTANNLDDGVKLTFATEEPHVKLLRTSLERDAQHLAGGQCGRQPTELGMREAK